jgi:hypothetical protein
MNTNQIPPGIVAFKRSDAGNISEWLNAENQYHYNDWVKMHFGYKDTIHTISVDGKQWSVGDEIESQFNRYIIQSFNWDSRLKAWYFVGKGIGSAPKYVNWKITDLTKLTSVPDKGEGEEIAKLKAEIAAFKLRNKFYYVNKCHEYEAELQSLQAYNGKLVEAAKWVLEFITLSSKGERILKEALSSFTDKEIKP